MVERRVVSLPSSTEVSTFRPCMKWARPRDFITHHKHRLPGANVIHSASTDSLSRFTQVITMVSRRREYSNRLSLCYFTHADIIHSEFFITASKSLHFVLSDNLNL